MGVVLEEVANGTQKNIASVYVAEVVPGSNAEKMGVREGDLLVSCSAVTLKAGKEGAYAKQGHGGRPFDNFQKGVFVSANQTFDITMAAIASNNERWGFNTVDCTFARACATSSEDL
ncbi:PDZ domain-containing protein [Pycnococcus provasolii]